MKFIKASIAKRIRKSVNDKITVAPVRKSFRHTILNKDLTTSVKGGISSIDLQGV